LQDLRQSCSTDETHFRQLSEPAGSAAQETATIAGYEIGLTKRSFHGDLERLHSKGLYSIRRILSPSDECLDFGVEEVTALLEMTKSDFIESPGSRSKVPDVPSGRVIRRKRPPERGLLILYPLTSIDRKNIDDASSFGVNLTDHPLAGFAVSFPSSSTAEPMEYVVNKQFPKELLGDSDDEDGDDS
jgi:hypothetical protein